MLTRLMQLWIPVASAVLAVTPGFCSAPQDLEDLCSRTVEMLSHVQVRGTLYAQNVDPHQKTDALAMMTPGSVYTDNYIIRGEEFQDGNLSLSTLEHILNVSIDLASSTPLFKQRIAATDSVSYIANERFGGKYKAYVVATKAKRVISPLRVLSKIADRSFRQLLDDCDHLTWRRTDRNELRVYAAGTVTDGQFVPYTVFEYSPAHNNLVSVRQYAALPPDGRKTSLTYERLVSYGSPEASWPTSIKETEYNSDPPYVVDTVDVLIEHLGPGSIDASLIGFPADAKPQAEVFDQRDQSRKKISDFPLAR